jgi:hypothetical protein
VKTPIQLTAEVSDDDQPVRAEVRAGQRRPSLPNGTIITDVVASPCGSRDLTGFSASNGQSQGYR